MDRPTENLLMEEEYLGPEPMDTSEDRIEIEGVFNPEVLEPMTEEEIQAYMRRQEQLKKKEENEQKKIQHFLFELEKAERELNSLKEKEEEINKQLIEEYGPNYMENLKQISRDAEIEDTKEPISN
jgi:alanyl-tRNA synthetase